MKPHLHDLPLQHGAPVRRFHVPEAQPLVLGDLRAKRRPPVQPAVLPVTPFPLLFAPPQLVHLLLQRW